MEATSAIARGIFQTRVEVSILLPEIILISMTFTIAKNTMSANEMYPIVQYLWTHLCLRSPTIIKANISITMNVDGKSKKETSMASFFLNSIMDLEMNICATKVV